MTYFTITDQSFNECNACCCKSVSGSPGEIERWNIDYAPWGVPIGGKGISEIVAHVEDLYIPTPSGVKVVNGAFNTGYNTAGTFDLSTLVQYDGQDSPKYEVVPFYGPHFGKFTLDAATGSMVYTPTNGSSGWDRFYLQVSADGKKSIAQVLIGVENEAGAIAPQPGFSPIVTVPDARIELDRRHYLATLAVAISPAALEGAVYRVTVQATALDCDCNPFVTKSCYDLQIGKC